MRAAIAAVGGGTVASVMAGGWQVVVLLAVVVGLVLSAAAWVLADDGRTWRLATLLGRSWDDARPRAGGQPSPSLSPDDRPSETTEPCAPADGAARSGSTALRELE